MRFQMTSRTGHADFLDLPWDQPLADWETDRIEDIPAGIHRHVVRFVRYDDRLYVLKELPRRYAEREYRFLRHLREEGVPTVEVVGFVSSRFSRAGEQLEAVLVTEHLKYSLPYRLLFARRRAADLREPLTHALVHLLVRIHLAGFYWGDCSLSNTLFRRDAGRLAAYLVDTETGELHPELSPGQRSYDVELAIERCAGEVLDLQAQGLVPDHVDPVELGVELRERYERLWDELTREDVVGADEHYRIHARLERINELGYDVGEVELSGDDGEGSALRLRLHVVEPGRHRRILRDLTGLEAQDEQARQLLNDIANYGAFLSRQQGRPLDDKVVARRWLEASYASALAQVPPEYLPRREPTQIFIEILDHWLLLSARAGRDYGVLNAARDYVDQVLAHEPDEVLVTDTVVDESDPADGGLEHVP
jgi:hypothetical protein